MTRENFDKIVEKAAGCPIIVYGDNMMLFNINFEGNYYVQDMDNVYCIRTNTVSAGNRRISQQESPYEIVAYNYDEIQYMKIYPDMKTLSKFLEGTEAVIAGETVDEIKKAIMTSNVRMASSPRGNAPMESMDEYGDFHGVGVTEGSEPDPYLKKYQEYYNNKNNPNP